MGLKEAQAILGLKPLATQAEIRRAFREAAKAAHPDRPGGDAERFRQVVEAHQLLQSLKPSSSASSRLNQPPATVQRPTSAAASENNTLSVPPMLALSGGGLDHQLADGRKIRITLPAGLRTGDKLRVAQTDFEIAVRGDGQMMVRGDDVWITVAVEPHMLAEGGRIALDTPLGRRVVWITKKAGERGLVRLVGQGLPARGRHRQGHLFLRLAPHETKTDTAARTLLRRFTAAWAA